MTSQPPPAVAHRAAVLGLPVSHSLSPVLYRAGFAAAGLADWAFDAIECDADALPGLVAGLDASWAGFAVTMPGKQAAGRCASSRSERVRLLDAANTLVRTASGFHADNTDVDGVVGALRAAGVATSGRVLLLGGGGTARAAVAALAEIGWAGPLTIAGRRPSSTALAEQVADRLGITASRIGYTERELAAAASDASLVISTVPAGAADPFAQLLARVSAVFDVIYHPWPTPLAAAGEPGRQTVTGLDLLLHQALRQFELITGVPAPAEHMRAALRGATGTGLPLPI